MKNEEKPKPKSKIIKIKKSLRLHIQKHFKEQQEIEIETATAICRDLLERAKEYVHDTSPGKEDPFLQETLVSNIYRESIMYFIRSILTASDVVEEEYSEANEKEREEIRKNK